MQCDGVGVGVGAVEGVDHPVFGKFLADFGYKKVAT
jgi:hypothetical protein